MNWRPKSIRGGGHGPFFGTLDGQCGHRDLLATVSQWECEVIGERTKVALQHLKRQGRRTGSVPYGKRLVGGTGKLLEDNPVETVVVELARELRAAENTLQAVCDVLQAGGHVSRTGRPFAPSQIAQMCAA
jgi:site-specific DNA recombinase